MNRCIDNNLKKMINNKELGFPKIGGLEDLKISKDNYKLPKNQNTAFGNDN